MSKEFFDAPRRQSRIKSQIVHDYFLAWARVMAGAGKRRGDQRLCYLDLFSGPGRYENGDTSTPLMILASALADPVLSRSLVAIFNDANSEYAERLRAEIAALRGIEGLLVEPRVHSDEAGTASATILDSVRGLPTLLFADPWGYKGLTQGLIGSVLRAPGSECIFFFNYDRMNAALSNDVVTSHMDAFFGAERAARLRVRAEGMSRGEREDAVVSEMFDALRESGGEYILAFRFRNASGVRTKHHLVFVTKHLKGYSIMKHVMASFSSSNDQGVASFEFNPREAAQPSLFDDEFPLDDLEQMLLQCFAGRQISVGEIIREHMVGTRYVDRNYRDVLRRLEEDGTIEVSPRREERRVIRGEVTFAESVLVTFPSILRDEA